MPDTAEYAATFALVDSDGDGLISAEEFVSLMGRLGEECTTDQGARAIAAMDGDSDGRVSLDEFTRYMAHNET